MERSWRCAADAQRVTGARIDLAAAAGAERVILVEGRSDKAALEALAGRRGQPVGPRGSYIAVMNGVTNIGQFVALLGPHGLNARISGLCDAGQEGHVRRALQRGGVGTSTSRASLEALGFYVCVADLEDELIRALGAAAVERIVGSQGELRSFRTFQRQPAQRQRSAVEQLHRFMGTRSGRKSRYARLLAAALDPGRVPRPLSRVLADG